MNFVIRSCVIDDAQYIYQINKAEMGYSFSQEDTAVNLEYVLSDPSACVFVAEYDGKVIGYVHAEDYLLLYAPPMKNILGIAVLSEYQNNGVGRALLTELELYAKQSGAGAIRLVSGEERDSAHIFYEKCGYTLVKKQNNYRKNI